MTDAPKQIWINPGKGIIHPYPFSDAGGVEYVRADLDQTDHLNEMLTNICKEHQALMRAAFDLCNLQRKFDPDATASDEWITLYDLCKDYDPQ